MYASLIKNKVADFLVDCDDLIMEIAYYIPGDIALMGDGNSVFGFVSIMKYDDLLLTAPMPEGMGFLSKLMLDALLFA